MNLPIVFLDKQKYMELADSNQSPTSKFHAPDHLAIITFSGFTSKCNHPILPGSCISCKHLTNRHPIPKTHAGRMEAFDLMKSNTEPFSNLSMTSKDHESFIVYDWSTLGRYRLLPSFCRVDSWFISLASNDRYRSYSLFFNFSLCRTSFIAPWTFSSFCPSCASYTPPHPPAPSNLHIF